MVVIFLLAVATTIMEAIKERENHISKIFEKREKRMEKL